MCRLDDDALASARARHDHPAELVSQHQWLADDRFADAAVLVPMEIRPAEADRGDAHELLPGGGEGLWFLMDTDVFGAV